MLNCADSVLLSGLPFDSSRGVFDRQDSFRSDYLSDRDSRYGIVQQASIDSTDSRLCYLTSSEVSGDEGKGREEDDCLFIHNVYLYVLSNSCTSWTNHYQCIDPFLWHTHRGMLTFV